jgi:uncharacterized protein
MTDQIILKLEDQTGVMAENGPMRLIIQAWDKNIPNLKMAVQAAQFSFACLAQVAQCQLILRRQHSHLPEGLDSIPKAMVESVLATGEKDLTPMAAVAGSIADAVADWLFIRGMSRVIVNNGGDIAIRLADNETARVGIRPMVKSSFISHTVELSSSYHSWGVNTSGLGGRSLTRGIASAVTAFAETSSLADAAATAIANACFVKDDAIVQTMAQKIDPHTDIKDIFVTAEVGKLKKSCILQAMSRSLNKAEHYVAMGIIQGALIALEDKLWTTQGFDVRIAPLETVYH